MWRKVVSALILLACASVAIYAAGAGEKKAQGTISYLTWYTQGEETPLLDKFTQETGVQVKVEAVDGAKYGEILKMRMTAGDLPDVITCKQNFVEMLMREGWALDVSAEPAVALLDKAPAVKEALTYKGKIYSIPHEAGVGYGHMYYNKILLKKAGIPVPFNPASLDELESALDKIAKAGIEPVLFGAKDFWVTGFFTLRYFESAMYGELARRNGGKLIEPNKAYYDGIAKPSDGLSFAFKTLERWKAKGWIEQPLDDVARLICPLRGGQRRDLPPGLLGTGHGRGEESRPRGLRSRLLLHAAEERGREAVRLRLRRQDAHGQSEVEEPGRGPGHVQLDGQREEPRLLSQRPQGGRIHPAPGRA